MRQYFTKINVETNSQKLYEITNIVSKTIDKQDISEGMLTLYIKHTSASLLIQENADGSVLRDLEYFFDNLVPQNLDLYEHKACLLYTSPSPRDRQKSRMPSSA